VAAGLLIASGADRDYFGLLRDTVLSIRAQDRDAALGFDAGTIVRGHRNVLKAYKDQPASLFSRFLESVPGVRNNNVNQAKTAMARVGGQARAAADALSGLEPTRPEADRAFIDYCGGEAAKVICTGKVPIPVVLTASANFNIEITAIAVS